MNVGNTRRLESSGLVSRKQSPLFSIWQMVSFAFIRSSGLSELCAFQILPISAKTDEIIVSVPQKTRPRDSLGKRLREG